MTINRNILYLFTPVLLLYSCIGDDIINDTIEPEVRINNIIDSIGLGNTYLFEAAYFNNIGQSESISIQWSSSDPDIISISPEGLAEGLQKGSSMISARAISTLGEYAANFILHVGTETSSVVSIVRTGTIKSTSSYTLEGDFSLISISDNLLRLNIDDNFKATRALPGLYVYLSNNPNSISDAFEIGAVEVFSGAHSFDLNGVSLNDFSYLLYYCKPFNVKVGDGKFQN